MLIILVSFSKFIKTVKLGQNFINYDCGYYNNYNTDNNDLSYYNNLLNQNFYRVNQNPGSYSFNNNLNMQNYINNELLMV